MLRKVLIRSIPLLSSDNSNKIKTMLRKLIIHSIPLLLFKNSYNDTAKYPLQTTIKIEWNYLAIKEEKYTFKMNREVIKYGDGEFLTYIDNLGVYEISKITSNNFIRKMNCVGMKTDNNNKLKLVHNGAILRRFFHYGTKNNFTFDVHKFKVIVDNDDNNGLYTKIILDGYEFWIKRNWLKFETIITNITIDKRRVCFYSDDELQLTLHIPDKYTIFKLDGRLSLIADNGNEIVYTFAD